MSKIKICGLKRPEDIEYANDLKPDYIGFIMASAYPKRYVDDEKALFLRSKLDKDIKAVGVFVNDEIEHILKVAAAGIIDVVQLHGNESADYAAIIKKALGIPIIKAVRVRSADDIVDMQSFPADYLLLDSYVSGSAGGNGKTFDNTFINSAEVTLKMNGKQLKPYILAGGIDENNIEYAIRTYHPYAVDLSSSVETDGFKDREKMKKVIDIARKV